MSIRVLIMGLTFVVGLSVSGMAETTEKMEKKGFGISIAPSVIRLTGKPGEAQTATVRVLNNSESQSQVMSEISDVGNRVDEKGKLIRQFLPAGTLPFSCAKWLLLRESEFALKPKEFRDVNFLVSPPADSQGGSACVIFFRGIPVLENETPGGATQPQATVQIQPRLGAMVFYEIEGTIKRTGQLINFTYEAPTANAPLRILYVFKNAGNADILIMGTFYILDSNKTLAAKGDLKPVRTFPGDEGYGETEWVGSLPPGKYQLVATFELGPGAREVIVKEVEFSIPGGALAT